MKYLENLRHHLAADASAWLENLYFGRDERALQQAEETANEIFDFFLPLSEASHAQLERERLDMWPEGWACVGEA